MRIGCLQFAPQVGDVNNNLNRADAALQKAQNTDNLDLLVLPELAFSGYNFPSLAEISPFLEPTGSGISALWARTTALRFNCNVVVGYPEKVDVSRKWPTSPEFYNSALMVNKDGETIANYRKSFLYIVDEKWALEGQDGFFEGDIPGLGSVAMGICMDINPYRFEAPWHAFEFAFHVLEVKANLVIVTMAWLTRETPSKFSQLPQEPDFETLEYWIQRMEPIIRSQSSEEIIVVFCNRTGVEGDAVYAGTSAVVGIKDGEVNLYGVLGRGVKELLVVDTDQRPFAKLVKVEGCSLSVMTDDEQSGRPSSVSNTENSDYKIFQPAASPLLLASNLSSNTLHDSRRQVDTNGDAFEIKSCTAAAGSEQSPMSQTRPVPSRPSMPKLALQIPDSTVLPSSFQNWRHSKSPHRDDNEIPTPTAPSPTPLSVRPKFDFPGDDNKGVVPSSINLQSGASVVRARRADTPITPPFHGGWMGRARGPTAIIEAPPSPSADGSMGVSQRKTRDKHGNPTCLASPSTESIRDNAMASMIMTGSVSRAEASAITSDNEFVGVDKETQQRIVSDVQRKFSQLLHPALPASSGQPTAGHVRLPSTKSFNTSHPREVDRSAAIDDSHRSLSTSRTTISTVATPSALRRESTAQSQMRRSESSESPIYLQSDNSRHGSDKKDSLASPPSRSNLRGNCSSMVYSMEGTPVNSKKIDSPGAAVGAQQKSSRPVSRGRQPVAKLNATNGMAGGIQRSNVITNRLADSEVRGRPMRIHPAHSSNRTTGSMSTTGHRSLSTTSTVSAASWLFGTPSPAQTHPSLDSNDEFVAMINLVNHACPVHNSRQSGSVPPTNQHSHPEAHPRSQSQQQHHQHRRRPSGRHDQGTLHRQRRSSSGAPGRDQPPQSHEATPAQNSVYEIILPPHIRELVESMSAADSPIQSPLRVGRNTPKFDPPTPTAMQFSVNESQPANSKTV